MHLRWLAVEYYVLIEHRNLKPVFLVFEHSATQTYLLYHITLYFIFLKVFSYLFERQRA